MGLALPYMRVGAVTPRLAEAPARVGLQELQRSARRAAPRQFRSNKHSEKGPPPPQRDPNPCMARHRDGYNSLEQDVPQHLHQLTQAASPQASPRKVAPARADWLLHERRKHQGPRYHDITTTNTNTPTLP
jgi:hypothetical protein